MTLSHKTAEAHLLMVWDWAEVADVFEASWYVDFDGPTKLCPGDELLFRHVSPRIWLEFQANVANLQCSRAGFEISSSLGSSKSGSALGEKLFCTWKNLSHFCMQSPTWCHSPCTCMHACIISLRPCYCVLVSSMYLCLMHPSHICLHCNNYLITSV